MTTKCDFCQNKLKTNEGLNVREIVIDKNPGIIKLTDVLLDLFFCELDVSKICNECMETVSKQFIFKQKLRKNIQMPSSNVIIQISKFIGKTKETVSTSEHLGVMSIFPEHRKNFVETIQKFSPEICIFPATVEVVPKIYNESTPIVKKKTVTFNNFKNSVSSSSPETESDGSDYLDSKSSRKRKKKSLKSRNSGKKQKNSNMIKKNQSTPKSATNSRKSLNSPQTAIKTESSEKNNQEAYSILPD